MENKLFAGAASSIVAGLVFASSAAGVQRETDFNFDWKFFLQSNTNTVEEIVPLNDAEWREVRLPHDWSVEHSFNENLEGCTGYLPGGIGWYQKHFETAAADKQTYILFDGVYNNATFWLNGQLIGENPYGYSPVYFDITDLLKTDGSKNTITVHVDHSRYADGRWYTGSGIYRKVKLITCDKLHIPVWGTYVTTPKVSEHLAEVKLETKLMNAGDKACSFILTTSIVDPNGRVVSSAEKKLRLKSEQEKTVSQLFPVSAPDLWSPDSPSMYKAVSSLIKDGVKVDEYTTPFGIRSLEFNPQVGFLLNGKSTTAKGVCLHHDGGLVGAAVPEGVWRRRLSELKAAGCNAIRLSHNPFSDEFLNLCDEMGFLVQNEFFDEWDYAKDKRKNYHDRHDDYITRGYTEHFQQWAKDDLTRTMLRDRNHPSAFQWSIGNEIEWTYLHYRYVTGFWEDPNDPQKSGSYWGSLPKHSPEELLSRYKASSKGEYVLADTARKLSGWVRELDTTRPVTANMVVPQVSHVSGYADAIDLAGYSYRNIEIGWANKHFPDKQVTINENPGTWDDWKQVLERPGVFSIYMWTGIAYMGESNEKWPQKSWKGDMLNLAGFRNQGWNQFKSIWVDEPHVSIGTKPLADSAFEENEFGGNPVGKSNRAYRWDDSNEHWNYNEGERVLVEVCSNLGTVELFLNGRSLGSRSMSESEDRMFRWVVPFEAGTLSAKTGFGDDRMTARLVTALEPSGFTFITDKTTLSADGYDVAHLVVQLEDKDGNPVLTENREIIFELDGNARLLGVDTGAQDNVQDFQSDRIVTDEGRCLLIVQSKRSAGRITVTAKSNEMKSQSVQIEIK